MAGYQDARTITGNEYQFKHLLGYQQVYYSLSSDNNRI